MRDDRSGLLGIDRQIGLRIRMSRIAVGMSVDQLARSIDVPAQLLSDFEEGAVRAPTKQLFQIADVLDIPIRKFFDGLELDRLT
jgi:transcriptional regulator with XRE-family HTH domain